MLAVLRLCLLLGVILGVVLPKTSAALAQLGLVDDRVVVICTADGLVEISLAGTGDRPAPKPHHDSHCLLVHALDGVVAAAQPAWLRLAGDHPVIATQDLWRSHDRPNHGFARAPPRT